MLLKPLFFSAVLFAACVQAATVAFYNDYSINKKAVDDIVADLRREHEVIVAETADGFESLFASTAKKKIDLAILALQDRPYEATEFPNYTAFVENGGLTLFTDGNRRVSWQAFFGFEYRSARNRESFVLTDETLRERTGLETVALYNPGYETFSMVLADVNRTLALFEEEGAAILYLDGHVMINGFLLDTMQPYETAPSLQRKAAAVSRAQQPGLIAAEVDYLLNPPAPAAANGGSAAGGTTAGDGVAVPLAKVPVWLAVLFLTASLVRLRRAL